LETSDLVELRLNLSDELALVDVRPVSSVVGSLLEELLQTLIVEIL